MFMHFSLYSDKTFAHLKDPEKKIEDTWKMICLLNNIIDKKGSICRNEEVSSCKRQL